MAFLDKLQNIDIGRLASEIVQDTANDLKDEVNVGKMLSLLKEGNSPQEIAMKLGQDLNVVEVLKAEAIKNVKEEIGLDTSNDTIPNGSATAAAGTSSTGDKISGGKIKREDIEISEMPMSGKVDRDKIQFDDE